MLKKIACTIISILFVTDFIAGFMSSSKYQTVYMNTVKEDRIKQKQQDVQSKEYTIAIVSKLESIPYFKSAEEGTKEAAKDLGVKVIFTGPSIEDPDKQANVILELISRQVDAIVVSANDPFKLLPVLQEAREHNIKVITWDSDLDPTGREFLVNIVDPQIVGRHLMDALASNSHETGEFAIIAGSLAAANSNEWIKWIKKQMIENYPHMKLVDIVPSNDNFETAYAATKHILEKDPNLSGIIGLSVVAPPAAAQAVAELGKKGKVKVVGLSTPNLMRTYIKEDVSPVITLWSPQKLGYLTVVLAKNLLDGKYPYDRQVIANVGNIGVKNDIVHIGEPIDFTKENVDQYDF
ncbi:autoinducer 2 ABC transporter substrate-binding protein [Paenibacillus alginolyticus]|uniref:autoinducer 2 ABC transporter substrate-binding protein n=1 Tax=Paenibacillus alginolyticus TaxID=59839 RepID=UPI0003FB37A5|nr:autoinducer 2 ABC transporter substrate-binding protein [Paenibacillus alginolyticus]MCY9666742.1 autoinducer 2 ABC transporter substrate-binding protein [Paenibacillus alginolyticus]